MNLYEPIRREYEHGAGTIRAVARRRGVHRREARQALASAVPPVWERPKLPRPYRSSTRFWKLIDMPRASSGIPSDRSSSLGWKTCRRSGGVDATMPHLVSAFAAGAGLVLGPRATAEKSNEIAAIPELLSPLALAGCTVTIDAMGTRPAIAEAIQNRGADSWVGGQGQPAQTGRVDGRLLAQLSRPSCRPHSALIFQTVEKNPGRL